MWLVAHDAVNENFMETIPLACSYTAKAFFRVKMPMFCCQMYAYIFVQLHWYLLLSD